MNRKCDVSAHHLFSPEKGLVGSYCLKDLDFHILRSNANDSLSRRFYSLMVNILKRSFHVLLWLIDRDNFLLIIGLNLSLETEESNSF